MLVSSKVFKAHDKRDEERFDSITSALGRHDKNVNEKHAENLKLLEALGASQNRMKTTLDDIIQLRPAIEAGLALDAAEAKVRAEIDFRKKLARRVFAAVLTTAVTVGGLIPLFQWIASFHFSIGIS